MQAALALAPLNLIEAAHKDAQWRAWGNEIFVTAVLAIIVCASVGVIAVNILSSRCLTKVQPYPESKPLSPGFIPSPHLHGREMHNKPPTTWQCPPSPC